MTYTIFDHAQLGHVEPRKPAPPYQKPKPEKCYCWRNGDRECSVCVKREKKEKK